MKHWYVLLLVTVSLGLFAASQQADSSTANASIPADQGLAIRVGQTGGALSLSEQEKNWIKMHPVIKVASDPDFSPIDFIDDNGNHSGMMADYLQWVKAKTGLQFEYYPVADWAEALEAVKSKKADLLPGAQRTPSRDPYLTFTDPVVKIPAVIITRQGVDSIHSLNDLAGRRVASVLDSAASEYVLKQVPTAKPVPATSFQEAFQQVALSQADAVVINLAVASYIIQRTGLTNLKVAANIGDIFLYRFGVRGDWEELRSILDKTLLSMPQSYHDSVNQRWITLYIDTWQLGVEYVVAIVALVLFLVLSLLWNQRLRKEVVVRTQIEHDLQQVTLAAQVASRAKSQFLANMSHEIRTPMNGIIGLTRLLRQTPLGPVQQDYVDKIIISSELLLEIINDILDFSKIEAGRLTLDIHSFRLHEHLYQVISLLEVKAKEKQLKLEFEMDPELPDLLEGDPLRIKQILLNLGTNAIKFTSQGYISIKVRGLVQGEEYITCQFVVEDTGVGIAPEFQQRLFDAFTQEDSSTTRRFGGSGLGLAICRRLTEAMGGEISVTSEQGKGSRFVFDIRLKRAIGQFDHGVPLPAAESEAEARPLAGYSLLVVEDNPINMQIVYELLTGYGAQVAGAEDGSKAVSMLRTTAFDLVLMDLQMPNMDGFEATRVIRQELGLTKLPIVAMTASVLDRDRKACIDAGMNDHLGKPVAPERLLAMLQRWLVQSTSVLAEDAPEEALVDHVDVSVTPQSLAELKQALVELEQKLELGDVDVLGDIEKLKAQPGLSQAVLGQLAGMIRNLDFEAAGTVLQELQDKLEATGS